MNKTGTTEQSLLIIHKTEPHVRRRPPESTTLATPFSIHYSSFVSISDWPPIFLENRETQDWLRPGGPTCLRSNPTPLATCQAPSIRVRHAGHAAHYILHLVHVLLWLAAFLSRMPLDRRGTRDWLRPGGPTCLRPDPTPLQITRALIGKRPVQ
uniref:Uncharacterized protein n=1 Tax=Mesocestoides corti TaxID=53468 RepID=A0A5K3FF02_MESCO